MKSLYYPDSSFISYIGSLTQRRILLILNRDNPTRETQVLQDYVASIAPQDCAIVWYDFPYRRTLFFRFHWEALLMGASTFQIAVWYLKQAGQFFWHLPKWLRVSSKQLEQARSITNRCESLRQFLGQFSPDQKIFFLTQSAGGRVASLISNDCEIERMVCLGYPFKHPDKAPEPERYLHLETITTPLLILQGKNDPYGTQKEVSSHYKTSPAVTVEFVPTDHDFQLEGKEKERVVSQVKAFLSV